MSCEGRTGDAEGNSETSAHEAPEAKRKPLRLGVEGDVGQRALGVMVRRRHLRARGVEAPTGNDGGGLGRGTNSDTGEHLDRFSQLVALRSD